MPDTPVLLILLALSISISVLSIWYDGYLSHPQLADWRKSSGDVWDRFASVDDRPVLHDVNKIYRTLFDKIYGRRILSRHRLLASSTSTTLAVILFTFVLGFNTTAWPIIFEEIRSGYPALVVVASSLPLFFNYLPDYVSLIETRFILKLAEKATTLQTFLLVLLDLLLTTLIFLGGVIFWKFFEGVLNAIGFGYVDISVALEVGAENVVGFIMFPKDGVQFILEFALVFYLTTFVTSFLWICYVLTYGVVKVLHITGSTRLIYQRGVRAGIPATVLSGVLIIIMFGIYGLSIFLRWIVAIFQ